MEINGVAHIFVTAGDFERSTAFEIFAVFRYNPSAIASPPVSGRLRITGSRDPATPA